MFEVLVIVTLVIENPNCTSKYGLKHQKQTAFGLVPDVSKELRDTPNIGANNGHTSTMEPACISSVLIFHGNMW